MFYTSAEATDVFVTYLLVRQGLIMFYMLLFLQSRKVRNVPPAMENAL